MASWLNGVHLTNGAQDVELILTKGYRCFTFLDGQQPEALKIRQAAPDSLLVMRLYSSNFLESAPLALAQRIKQFPFEHVIPWNEANLGYEVGQSGAEQTADWKESNLNRIHSYWEEFLPAFRSENPGKLLHFPAWSPWDGDVGPFWPGADVYDLHLYGRPEEMLSYLDRCLPQIPEGKPVYISEWNFGRPWDETPRGDVARFLNGLTTRSRAIGAAAFIWKWEHPDAAFPNLDLIGTAAADALGSWEPRTGRTEVASVSNEEYGFAGLYDGFDDLVAKIGATVVGKALHPARYLASDYAYQLTEKGRLEAVKLDDGSWASRFYPSYPQS